MRILSFISVVSSLLLVAGCETDRDTAYRSSPVYGGEIISSGPYGATMVVPSRSRSQIEADRALENNLRTQLSRYGDLATTTPDVQFYAQNGSVTLYGTVPSQREQAMIESLVRNTPGVTVVKDEMKVGYPPTGVVSGPARVYTTPPDYVVSQAPAIVYSGNNLNLTLQATTLADRNLGQRIIDRLRADPNLPALSSAINISVSAGTLYLRGTVDTEAQHLSIVSTVQHTYGVSAVYDQLLVR